MSSAPPPAVGEKEVGGVVGGVMGVVMAEEDGSSIFLNTVKKENGIVMLTVK